MFLVPMTRDSRVFARNFDRLFDETFGGIFTTPAAPGGEAAARTPALDVAESDRAYTVRLDMPGVKKEDVKVTVEGRRVNVSAQSASTDEKKDGDDRIVYRERSATSYSRSFAMPAEVDQAGDVAKLEHGVLSLELPKKAAAVSAITIN